MKPAKFKYWDPNSVDQATAFLAERGEDTKLLAGGQSLMPVLNMRLARTDYLLDLNRLADLDYVKRDDGWVRVGALTRQDALLESSAIRGDCPLLARAVPYIGHAAIRYRGTIGGSLAHADPAAELPAVMAALDAEMTLTSAKGSRVLGADQFFVTYFTTALEPTEILTEIRIPVQPRASGSAVREMARRHGDFALVGIAIAVTGSGDRIASARACAFGVDEVARRLDTVEALLNGERPTPELFDEVRTRASEAIEPESDMHASAEYRREVCGVLTDRALREALTEAGVET